jgi:hypothetical protein
MIVYKYNNYIFFNECLILFDRRLNPQYYLYFTRYFIVIDVIASI